MYFIRDCNGQIVGNAKGYRTFRGANAQVNNRGSKIKNLLWARYTKKEHSNPLNRPLVFSIIKREPQHD
jgi:hypothetical protein